jgi:hypothetical protein
LLSTLFRCSERSSNCQQQKTLYIPGVQAGDLRRQRLTPETRRFRAGGSHTAQAQRGDVARVEFGVAFGKKNHSIAIFGIDRNQWAAYNCAQRQAHTEIKMVSFENLPTDIYSRTAEFNGMVASRRRQPLTVVDGVLIKHGKLFPNKEIKARVIVEGKRGARYEGFLFQSGYIKVM